MNEHDFLSALRRLPLHPGAHGLTDDTASLAELSITTDTIVEGVHFLPDDPPGDVAWKLVAVNLSDLAAKGATPAGVLLNYPLARSPAQAGVQPQTTSRAEARSALRAETGPRPAPGNEDDWDIGFLAGLGEALTAFNCPIIGGDTVSLPAGVPRVLTMTAFGRDGVAVPRSAAQAGDALWVTGTIGDAGAGLRIARGENGPANLLAAYRRPQPRLAEGRALAPHVHAMMDVSDGLLLDASRMAEASALGVAIDLALVPLSSAYRAFAGDDRAARIAAATAGDDYQLLFAAPPAFTPSVPATRIGAFTIGTGLSLTDGATPVPLPASLGFRH
ncbi:thiamine-monophosphate kinase [Sphingomonas panacisoli]|uniref:Thiamine-monophosphate kinase n=1 Tax=Sphingomonas panacisoli TaxID=1813879 RepID=A0A5B8LF03_9SPHN|nr:thiamine-phosphate kinase [Sphingomonas panacisoli]QDZ06449.1 thiamine-monophosphate kinase [Sphingomonas panacisoli]